MAATDRKVNFLCISLGLGMTYTTIEKSTFVLKKKSKMSTFFLNNRNNVNFNTSFYGVHV